MDESGVTWKQQGLAFTINGLIFVLVYQLAGCYAAQLLEVPSIVFAFEKQIPFIPWLILPYMSSGLFFVLVFFVSNNKKELYLLTYSMLFVTLVSGTCFFLFPLRFSFPQPVVDYPLFNHIFEYLHTWDTRFNQAPSLHVSYACLFWSVLSSKLQGVKRFLVGLWIFLMALATLCIYQHHIIDVLTALLLICITFFIFPNNNQRNQRIAMVYFFSALLLLIIGMYQHSLIIHFIIVWLTITLVRLGWAYLHADAHFLKNNDGTLKPMGVMICLPYMFTYQLLRRFFCKNADVGMIEIYPQLFIGAMPDSRTIKKKDINKHLTIIDLTAELAECKILRTKANYYACPMLDLASAKQEEVEQILMLLTHIYQHLQTDDKIYVHCLMGYSRSVLIATLFIKQQSNMSLQETIAHIQKRAPHAKYSIGFLNNA